MRLADIKLLSAALDAQPWPFVLSLSPGASPDRMASLPANLRAVSRLATMCARARPAGLAPSRLLFAGRCGFTL